MRMIGDYNGMLIALSLAITVAASYAALALTGRVTQTAGLARAVWLAGGSAALGIGIWSMHVVGALALPTAEPLAYDASLGLLSIGLAIAISAFALAVVSGPKPLRWTQLLGAGLVLGAAIVSMHHASMAAMRLRGPLLHDPIFATASVASAILSGVALLWLAARFRHDGGEAGRWRRGIGALVLGAALVGAQLVGMAGARVAPAAATLPGWGRGLPVTRETTLALAAGSLLVLALTLVAANVDRGMRRRRAETEALRRSEDRFRTLVEASSQIVWTIAPDGQMVAPQASWAEFTGQSFQEYRNSGWFSAVHPEDREATARLWEDAMANRTPLEVEHRVRRHDGQYRDCVARVVPVVEADGSVREWIGTHTDVTEGARMKQDRETLAEAGRVLSSSLDYRETLGAVARLIVPRLADWCTVDMRTDEGRLERLVAAHVDPHRVDLLRELQDRFPFRPDGEHGVPRVLRTEQSELIRDASDSLLHRVAEDAEHLRLLREVGFASSICVPFTARGQVLGVLSMVLAEAGENYDLRDLAFAEELARRAAIAIDNARLYAEAQRALRARDEVLGIVSHDLRNPINVIAMSSEMLLEMELPADRRRRQLEIIRRSAHGMGRLIQDLLDVSRTESGRLSVDPHPEDAGAIAEEACDLMRPLAEERSQQLTARVADRLPPIRADRRRLEQVLSNLIGNAFKFVPAGGAIHVEADAAGEEVRFSVRDTGPGIAPEDLPFLFEAHWQAKETAHLGAGLGLAICKGIVEAHGGRIWVESAVGRGTCFYFTVPTIGARESSGQALPERQGDRREAGGDARVLGSAGVSPD
jgi:PAS domain S-box-containing protein